MSKVKMQKIEIIGLLSDSRSITERLQRRGVLELTQCEDKRAVTLGTESFASGFERSRTRAEEALQILKSVSKKKPSLTDSLRGRKAVSTKTFSKMKENTDATMAACHSIIRLQKRINENAAEISRSATRIDMLAPWLELELPQNFYGTKYTVCRIGSFDRPMTEYEIESVLAEDTDGAPICVRTVGANDVCTHMTVMFLKCDAVRVDESLRKNGFSPIPSPTDKTPREETAELNEKIRLAESDSDKCRSEIAGFADIEDDICFLLDYLAMRRDKYIAVGKMAMTQNTVIITGYIPQKYVRGLEEEFESRYTLAISVSEPSEDDDVPVLLSNGRFSSPVEGITEMYALPNKHDVDPSAVMAFFYYLFFGMMLSDAGYGLVMFVATSVILHYFPVEGTLRRSLTMFKYCGVSTLFWGILFGSWFGDLPQVIASQFFGKEIATTALWFEPLANPIKLLLFSFALGIAHLFLGLGVNFGILWREGRKADAVCDVIPVYITILGAAPAAASILADVPGYLVRYGLYTAAVGAVLILLTSGRSGKNIFMRIFGGVYGLYNVATGYLSDILSYSRLLALGLATGSIASVINLIATMPQNTAAKAILLVVVGLVGHTANMGINLLGAYVHADRLQFVELFSKFYEGGGRAFKPLKADTKYIKFEKENIYDDVE